MREHDRRLAIQLPERRSARKRRTCNEINISRKNCNSIHYRMPGNEGHTFHCRAAFTRARHNKEKLTSYPLDSQCPNIENSGSFLGRPAGPCGGKTPTEAGGARTRPAYKRTENMHNTTKKILKMRRSRGTAEGNLSKWLRVFVAERSETKTPECGIACVTIETKFQLKVHCHGLNFPIFA